MKAKFKLGFLEGKRDIPDGVEFGTIIHIPVCVEAKMNPGVFATVKAGGVLEIESAVEVEDFQFELNEFTSTDGCPVLNFLKVT